LILGGWSKQTDIPGKDPLSKKIDQIQELVYRKQWEPAAAEVRHLENLYHKSKWKLQLLGDETEYEGMERELSKLKSAVEIWDSAQAMLQLATLRSILQAIYTM